MKARNGGFAVNFRMKNSGIRRLNPQVDRAIPARTQTWLTFAGHVPIAVTLKRHTDARSTGHLANYGVFGECSTGET